MNTQNIVSISSDEIFTREELQTKEKDKKDFHIRTGCVQKIQLLVEVRGKRESKCTEGSVQTTYSDNVNTTHVFYNGSKSKKKIFRKCTGDTSNTVILAPW